MQLQLHQSAAGSLCQTALKGAFRDTAVASEAIELTEETVNMTKWQKQLK